LFADFFSTANLVQMKKQVKAHLNSLFKLVIQLSVAEFHFVKGQINPNFENSALAV